VSDRGPGDLTSPDTGALGPLTTDIQGATFSMGSPGTEPCRLGDETQHSVTLTRAFTIHQTEVTQRQFEALMGYNPSKYTCADCPVETVTWYEAAAYCSALSSKLGLNGCYSCTGAGTPGVTCAELPAYAGDKIYGCPGFRLPTEAEWERAYRAGSTGAYYSGSFSSPDCSTTSCTVDANVAAIAWYCGNATGGPRPVGTKQPNTWGLFDMAGNVWEWTHDWYQAFSSDAVTDPGGPTSGTYKAVRGGGWSSHPQYLRAAKRMMGKPVGKIATIGFRCSRTRTP